MISRARWRLPRWSRLTMTPLVARTLMQQALPTTFGLKAAGWLVAVIGARTRLAELRERPRRLAAVPPVLCALPPLGDKGAAVVEGAWAARLGFGPRRCPWHTDRAHVAELGAALAMAAGFDRGEAEALDRWQVDVADRGGRAGRAVRRRPRPLLDHAPEAQPGGLGW